MDRRGIAAGTIYFNPRTREGCDAFLDVDLYPIQAISIHAPVKGATWPFVSTMPTNSIFQSTHP